MYLAINDEMIPGTVIYRRDMDGSTGIDFLNKIYFLKDGIALSQVRDISGLDGSTLQNWVKRGWISNTINKLYPMNTFARIIIINMLRDSMQLSKISYLLSYINGSVDDRADDIIPESKLYDYICRITDRLIAEGGNYDEEKLRDCIEDVVNESDLNLAVADAKKRLVMALEVIITTRFASLMISYADKLFERLV